MPMSFKLFIVVSLLFSIVGCASSYEPPYYSQLADQLVNKHIKDMKREGLHVYMTGGGMRYDVDKINLGFDSKKVVSVQEARTMYVRGVESLLSRVNRDMEIRKYLHNYPFTISNLTYHLGFPERPLDQTGVFPIAFVFTVGV